MNEWNDLLAEQDEADRLDDVIWRKAARQAATRRADGLTWKPLRPGSVAVCPNGHAMDDGLFNCPSCGAYRPSANARYHGLMEFT